MPRRVKLILANDILSGNEFKNMRELGSDVKQDLFIFLCVWIRFWFAVRVPNEMRQFPKDTTRPCVFVVHLLCVRLRPSAI